MTELAHLPDRRRELAGGFGGLDVGIAMALGDRDGAQRARKEMEVQIGARLASREAGCYFDAEGWGARLRMAAVQGSAK